MKELVLHKQEPVLRKQELVLSKKEPSRLVSDRIDFGHRQKQERRALISSLESLRKR